MPHMRSLKFLLSVCVVASAACTADAPTSPRSNALTSRVQQLGIQDHGDHVVVAGDARLSNATLTELNPTIHGWVDVNSSPSCHLKYEAVVSGGTPPYTYSWQTDGTIKENYGDVIYAAFSPAGSYWVRLTVTDSNDQQATVQADIQSADWEFECYD